MFVRVAEKCAFGSFGLVWFGSVRSFPKRMGELPYFPISLDLVKWFKYVTKVRVSELWYALPISLLIYRRNRDIGSESAAREHAGVIFC